MSDLLGELELDSDVLSRGEGDLSVGQKQRTCLARALIGEPDILLLDEPTAGLDPRARRNLINYLRDLPMTMLVSTHDMAMVAELFRRMAVMDGGQIVAEGNTSDILADEALLARHGLELPWPARPVGDVELADSLF